MAYLLLPGENDAPPGLCQLLVEGNRLQDIYMAAFEAGLSGNQLLNKVLESTQEPMRADCLLSIVMLLQSRGKMTSSALAAEFEVSRPTILRDVEALSIAGIPIYSDGGHGGGVALDENYRTTLTGLKEAELHALFVASNHQLLAEIGLGKAAESAQRKLSAALPIQQQPTVDRFRQRIYIDPLWWWHEAEPTPFWENLQEAVYQDRCIQVVYENYNGEISQRLLEPYAWLPNLAFGI